MDIKSIVFTGSGNEATIGTDTGYYDITRADLFAFAADFIGCLFSPFGYNPIYCIPPILYGICGGLFRFWTAQKPNLLRLLVAFLPAVVLGSIGIQSCVLAFMQYGAKNFVKGLIYFLSTRSVQFAIMLPVNSLLVWLLLSSKLFHRMGIWPPRKERKK